MELEINKFGGASLSDADNFRNVAKIISNNLSSKSIIVASALGKTTNALEKVVTAHFENNFDIAQSLASEIKLKHYEIIDQLFSIDKAPEVKNEINDVFVELEWFIEDEPEENYNYNYDQIVCVGELCSTKILYNLLLDLKLNVCYLDVRDVFVSSNDYRNAQLHWEESSIRIQKTISQLIEKYDFIVTQGYIAATTENFTTTLGREGSDYTAAIFASCTNAKKITVWKDVLGVYNCDPNIYGDAKIISKINYDEVLTMCYYGAKIIHPKTIIPIKSKQIPLNVRSFNDLKNQGTIISKEIPKDSISNIKVIEKQNFFVRVANKQGGLITESQLSFLFATLNEFDLVVRMFRSSALELICCIHDPLYQMNHCQEKLNAIFNISECKEVNLLTLRNYNIAEISTLIQNEDVLFESSVDNNLQYVLAKDSIN